MTNTPTKPDPNTPQATPIHDPRPPVTIDPKPAPVADPELPPTGTEPDRFNDHTDDEMPDNTTRSSSSLYGDAFLVETGMQKPSYGDESQAWEEQLTREAVEDSPNPDEIGRP